MPNNSMLWRGRLEIIIWIVWWGAFIAIVLCEILASAPVVCHFSVAGGTRSPCLAVSEASVMGIQLYHFWVEPLL